MNEEMSTKLSQELLLAEGEDARARVIVKWLPDFARCQVTTSARVKQLVAKVDELARKMDDYHAPKEKKEEQKMETAQQQTRLALAMKFFKENWQSVVLFLLFLKAFGLEDLLKDLFMLAR